jgi:DnaJ-class molecular chaperone
MVQDVNKEPGAEEKFKKIGEAYEVIGTHFVTFTLPF